MPATLKLENIRYLVTIDSGRRILTDAAVLINGNQITHVGKTPDLSDVPADRTIDARHFVVTPGFVNGHMHISYAHAVRGLFPDDLGPAYLPSVFLLQAAMTPDEEYRTSLLAITELLKYGTTTFLDPGSTKHLDACLPAYQQSGCRIIVGSHACDLPNPFNLPVLATAQAIRDMEQTIADYNGALDGRVRAWTMPFAPPYCTPELLTAAKGLADGHTTGMTTHFNFTPRAAAEWMQQHGQLPCDFLADLNVLGPNVLLAHVLGLDPSEVDTLSATGASVVVCPTAALKGAAGMTRTGLLPELLAAGVTIGLGTDAGNNSNLLETLRSMYLIAVLYKDARQDWRMVPAETALELATIGGAQALGLSDEIGSIEVGKKADLVLFDTQRPEWSALHNPVNSLVYNADGRSVHTVIVDGKIVVQDHTPLFVDEQSLIPRSKPTARTSSTAPTSTSPHAGPSSNPRAPSLAFFRNAIEEIPLGTWGRTAVTKEVPLIQHGSGRLPLPHPHRHRPRRPPERRHPRRGAPERLLGCFPGPPSTIIARSSRDPTIGTGPSGTRPNRSSIVSSV